MIERQVYITGQMVPESKARISIFDSAVMLGDTATESTRTFRHRPFKLANHIERLFKSLKIMRIDPGCNSDQLLTITQNVLETNLPCYAQDQDCWIVHNISRGLSMAGSDPTVTASGPTVMIFTQPLDLRSWAGFYSNGCHAVTSMSRAVPAQSLDARIKNRSRLAYTLAEAEVKLIDPAAQGVILDIYGNVSENKGGNIFVVADGVLRTPTTTNCLAGMSRATVLQLAHELGITCEEAVLQPYDLATAEEMFFTSTPYCIMPATRFNGMDIADGQVGSITRKLLSAWSDLVGVDIPKQAEAQL